MKKLNKSNYIYFFLFATLLLFVELTYAAVSKVKEYELNGVPVDVLYKISLTFAIFIAVALSIILPIITLLKIKPIKLNSTDGSALNNWFVYTPAICFLIFLLAHLLIFKNFSLWVLLLFSPALVSTIFNKLILDESKNNS